MHINSQFDRDLYQQQKTFINALRLKTMSPHYPKRGISQSRDNVRSTSPINNRKAAVSFY
jgi:hypothetical protein